MKDLRGDVISIINIWGDTVVRYTYDAWGKCTVKDIPDADIYAPANLGEINPFRYRSYYYDEETELYYLQSRYYDPDTGRFVNGDDSEIVSNSSEYKNLCLFSYCENNPVNKIDYCGFASRYITKQTKSEQINMNGKNICMKNIPWGRYGNIADNGCGIIAAYNVLNYYCNVNFASVHKELTFRNGPLLEGMLGLNPIVLTTYLRSKFWKVYTASSWLFWWSTKACLSDCIIILYAYKNLAGAHYIAGIRSGKINGWFNFYNANFVSYKKSYTINNILTGIKGFGGIPLAFWGVKYKK